MNEKQYDVRRRVTPLRRLLHGAGVLVGGAAFTLAFFMVLPLIQAITQEQEEGMRLNTVDAASLPPPPPPPEKEEEPPEEEEAEEEPPELTEEAEPLSLDQLELALNPGGFGDSGFLPDLGLELAKSISGSTEIEEMLNSGDLDQTPRATYQPSPVINAALRKRTPATVYIIFEVNKDGKVVNPKVLDATDTAFERPALSAVKQWRFEPGKHKGQAVSFRMRVPIVFPEQKN